MLKQLSGHPCHGGRRAPDIFVIYEDAVAHLGSLPQPALRGCWRLSFRCSPPTTPGGTLQGAAFDRPIIESPLDGHFSEVVLDRVPNLKGHLDLLPRGLDQNGELLSQIPAMLHVQFIVDHGPSTDLQYFLEILQPLAWQ